MATSRVPATLTALVAAFEAVLDPSIVYDGPEITGEVPPVAVCVGYDGDPDGDMRAVENWTQTWAGLGQGGKYEAFDVLGCVIAFSGETTIVDKRAAVFATFATVETVVRPPSLPAALGLSSPAMAEFAAGEFYQEQTTGGLQCRIPFTVSFSRVRI